MTANKATAKRRVTNPVEYIFVAFDVANQQWLSSSMFAGKADAKKDWENSYETTEYIHEFFLEVKLPRVPEARKELEYIPTYRV